MNFISLWVPSTGGGGEDSSKLPTFPSKIAMTSFFPHAKCLKGPGSNFTIFLGRASPP